MQRGFTLCLVALLIQFSLVGSGMAAEEPRDPKAGTAGAAGALQGTIRVSGAWALYPMMVRWGEEFNRLHPKLRIDISAGGAGKGMTDALSGLVDMGMISREIKPEETKKGAFFVPVVKDAVFPTMNAANPVLDKLLEKGVRKENLVDLWIGGKPSTWGTITGTSAKERVQVYTRSDSCGAAETWAQYLGDKKQEDLNGVGVYGDPGLAEAVRRDKLGIGFNNLNYAYDAKSGLALQGIRVIPIDVNGNGRVDPFEDLSTKEKAVKAVVSGVYPSPPARDLHVATKDGFKGPAGEFVRWILADGQKYVEESGYIRLSEKQIKEALKKMGKK
ncbi:MAG: phosphate ABC transporter substrate-binding protein [Deltaproteobacteria bacterium]|nr:MAG: phosphate ABC transporter substrate-binding protein [Deltaproteobacteria bacterium]